MFNFFRRKRYVLKHRLLGTYFGPLSKNGRFDGTGFAPIEKAYRYTKREAKDLCMVFNCTIEEAPHE